MAVPRDRTPDTPLAHGGRSTSCCTDVTGGVGMTEHRARREALRVGLIRLAQTTCINLAKLVNERSASGPTTEESNAKPALNSRMHPIVTSCARMVLRSVDGCSSGRGATSIGSSKRCGWLATMPAGPMSSMKMGSATAQIPCSSLIFLKMGSPMTPVRDTGSALVSSSSP